MFSWDNLCEVTQYATVDTLVRPRQVVAGRDGRILGIVLKELALYASTIPALRKIHIVLCERAKR